MGCCKSCKRYLKLNVKCECDKVAYCSDVCKQRDLIYHADRCEKQAFETEDI